MGVELEVELGVSFLEVAVVVAGRNCDFDSEEIKDKHKTNTLNILIRNQSLMNEFLFLRTDITQTQTSSSLIRLVQVSVVFEKKGDQIRLD